MHTFGLAVMLALASPCDVHLVNVAPEAGLGAVSRPAPTARATRRKQIMFLMKWMEAGMIASASGWALGPDELNAWIDDALGPDARLTTFDESRAAETIEFLRKNSGAVAPPFGQLFLRYNRR